jgi:hypothetical protein
VPQYRLSCRRVDAGERLTIVASNTGAGAVCVDRGTADALLQRPFWQHADLEALCGSRTDLSTSALLTSGLIEPFVVHDDADAPASLVVVTADRPPQCIRAIECLAQDPGRSAHDAPIVVVDNSSRPQSRERLFEHLRDAARRHRLPLLVFTPRTRESLVAAIASQDAAAADAARFALLTVRPGATNVGAVRNFINLVTVGQRVISIDDDVEGPVLRAPGDDMQWAANGDCAGIAPLASADVSRWTQASLVSAHLDVLGRSVGHERAPILVTVSGLRGDCGAEFPWRELALRRRGEPRRDLTRQVLRGAAQATVTPIDRLMTYAWGLCNDGHLPPFMPMGRNEDGAFGRMLRLSRADALTCHLPVYVNHRPAERRSDRQYRNVAAALAQRWRTNDLVAMLLSSVPSHSHSTTAAATIAERLSGVAARLAAGDLTPLFTAAVALQSLHLSSAHRWAKTSGWLERRGLLRQIERRRHTQFSNEAVLPTEWAARDVGLLAQYLRLAAETTRRWSDVRAVMHHLPKWRRPWTELGEAEGVFRCGPA